jgi:thiamine biosynthesis protein ThiS
MTLPETKQIEIVLNGEPRAVSAGLSVLDLLSELEIKPDRVAVELNRRIVRQPEWRTTRVEPGASIEIVQFVGGG